MTDNRSKSENFESKNLFFKKYAYFVLQAPISDASRLLEPFISKLNPSEGSSNLLKEFVYAQDHLAAYDNFWNVWELFKPKVIELSQDENFSYRNDEIIKAFLFALQWKPEAKSWHTFKERNVRFFSDMVDKLPSSPSTLFSIAKLLNGIGGNFQTDGIYWLAKIFKENSSLADSDLDDGTIYHLNTFIKKYLYDKRADVRKSPELMSDVLVILNFLINSGEVSGYLLRESIV